MVHRLPAKLLEPEEQAALENLPSDNVAQDHSRHCDGAAESALVIAASSLNRGGEFINSTSPADECDWSLSR